MPPIKTAARGGKCVLQQTRPDWTRESNWATEWTVIGVITFTPFQPSRRKRRAASCADFCAGVRAPSV
jgi:hypothetical protein